MHDHLAETQARSLGKDTGSCQTCRLAVSIVTHAGG